MKQNNQGFVGIVLVVIIALGVGVAVYFAREKHQAQLSANVQYQNTEPTQTAPQPKVNDTTLIKTTVSLDASLDTYKIVKPNLYVYGKNLSKVSIYGIPTGTGVTNSTTLGNATLQNTTSGMQTWIFTPTKDQLLLTSIGIQAFDNNGTLIKSLQLPLSGASSVYAAFY